MECLELEVNAICLEVLSPKVTVSRQKVHETKHQLRCAPSLLPLCFKRTSLCNMNGVGQSHVYDRLSMSIPKHTVI